MACGVNVSRRYGITSINSAFSVLNFTNKLQVPAIKAPNKGMLVMTEFANAKWTACIALLARLSHSWPGCGVYSEHLEKFKKSFAKRILDIYTPKDSNPFNVFNHGDFHFKNMMFNTFDGNTNDMLLVRKLNC